jgi:hypothetical protein
MQIIALVSFLIGASLSLSWDIFALVLVVADALPVVALIGFARGEAIGSIVVDLVVAVACMEAGFMAKLFVEILMDATRGAITKLMGARLSR